VVVAADEVEVVVVVVVVVDDWVAVVGGALACVVVDAVTSVVGGALASVVEVSFFDEPEMPSTMPTTKADPKNRTITAAIHPMT
jgi:hypothetical protein